MFIVVVVVYFVIDTVRKLLDTPTYVPDAVSTTASARNVLAQGTQNESQYLSLEIISLRAPFVSLHNLGVTIVSKVTLKMSV
jgi:hypothetical protein